MTYRAIVIDPRMQRVVEVALPEDDAGNLRALQTLVGGYIEAAHRFDNGDVLMVNEEGLLHGERDAFMLSGSDAGGKEVQTTWLMGQGVVIGSALNEGGAETASAKSSLDDIGSIVRFGRTG